MDDDSHRTTTATIILTVRAAVKQVALSATIGESIVRRLRSRLFATLLSRDAKFYDRVRTGAIMSWLGADVEVLGSTITKLLGARVSLLSCGLRVTVHTARCNSTMSREILAVLLQC